MEISNQNMILATIELDQEIELPKTIRSRTQKAKVNSGREKEQEKTKSQI